MESMPVKTEKKQPMQRIIFALMLLMLLSQCKQNDPSLHPEGLRKLTSEEMIERAKEGILPSPYVVFKMQDGRPLSSEEREQLNRDELIADHYIDENGLVVEMVVREKTTADELIQIQIREALVPRWYRVEEMAINCNYQKAILERAFEVIVNNEEKDGIDYSGERFRELRDRIINLINQCGFPTKKEVGEKAMDGIWMVLQYSDNHTRAAYYPMIKRRVEAGDLKKSQLAHMEDRMLMYYRKPQIYGTQMRRSKDGKLELYPLRDPGNVNKKRKEMGMESIEKYLSQWDLVFDPGDEN